MTCSTVPKIVVRAVDLSNRFIGGSQFRMLHAIEILQDKCDLTIVMPSVSPDWALLNAWYGTAVRPERIRIVSTILSPKKQILRSLGTSYLVNDRIWLDAIQNCDLGVSFDNTADFRKPGLHFMIDLRPIDPFVFCFSWSQYWKVFGKQLVRRGWRSFRSFSEIVSSPEERIVANSRFMAETIARKYGVSPPEVLYPPVVAEFPDVPWERRSDDFVCVGRIAVEKRIDRVVDILARLRERTGRSFRLILVGATNGDCRPIVRWIQKLDWVVRLGTAFGQKKRELLVSHKFAIHALEKEGFGISVAEYVKAGCVPFVPDSGGCREIVERDELRYRDVEDAVQKIMNFLGKPEQSQAKVSDEMKRRGQDFNFEHWKRRFKQIVQEELAKRGFDVEL